MIYEILLYQFQSCGVAINQKNYFTKHLVKDIGSGSITRLDVPRDGLTVKAEVIEDDVVFFVVFLQDLGSRFGRRIGKMGYRVLSMHLRRDLYLRGGGHSSR